MNPPGLDAEFANRLKREGGATGDLRISLIWYNHNDLDLHVIPPSGEELSFSHKRSKCGGHLDIDMNAGGGTSDQPIENVYWAHGGAPAGHYKIQVMQYSTRASGHADYRIELVTGNQVRHFKGTITGEKTLLTVAEFDYDGAPFEILHATDAVDQARAIATKKLTAQAASHGAELVIGSDIQVEISERPCGFVGCELNDLDVDISWLGTGVRKIPSEAGKPLRPMPAFVLAMTPIGRRKDVSIDADDASDDIEIAAEEAEEAALEADEANAPDEDAEGGGE
jgi:uncharacterized protein YbjQ (UPF0145 family)